VFKRWAKFFLADAWEVRKFIDQLGGMRVSVEDWANTYPLKYREEIYRELEKPHRQMSNFGVYDSFPKTELQFTTVSHDDKGTILNDVKERQISAPSMGKKIAAGSFTKALETVMALRGKGYGGPDNWPKIASWVDAMKNQLRSARAGEADYSACDMSLDAEFSEVLAQAMKIITLDNNSIIWDAGISPELCCQAYDDSIHMKVNVARGEVTYDAEGRASGDSWTTLGNGWINSSFWRFIASENGFNSDVDGVKPGTKPLAVKCKGDDTFLMLEEAHQKLFEAIASTYFAPSKTAQCAGLGVICRSFKWGSIDEISFLSNRFFQRSNGTYRMVRIPARVFESMPWTTKCVPTNRKWVDLVPQLAYSKGECLLAWGRGLPIFDKLARVYMQIGSKPDIGTITDYNPYSDTDRVWDQATDGNEDREACLNWMFDQFGITESEVQELEHIIDCMGTWDTISHPAIEKFFQ